MAEERQETMNIIEIFEQDPHAHKVVSLEELERKIRLFEENGIPFATEVDVDTPETVKLDSDTLESFRAEKASLTYTWSLSAKPSDKIKGRFFRSGLGLAYATAEDIFRGQDVNPSVLYAAFLACRDYSEDVQSGRLMRSIAKKTTQIRPT